MKPDSRHLPKCRICYNNHFPELEVRQVKVSKSNIPEEFTYCLVNLTHAHTVHLTYSYRSCHGLQMYLYSPRPRGRTHIFSCTRLNNILSFGQYTIPSQCHWVYFMTTTGHSRVSRPVGQKCATHCEIFAMR